MGVTLQHHILDASLLTDTSLVLTPSVTVHHQDIGFHYVKGREEVEYTTSCVDAGILDISDAPHHKQAFLFVIDGLVVFIFLDGGIATDTDIQVTVCCCLTEELHMTAM